ncbi:MAG: hypothetical protein ACRDJO_04030 [Actinomycetota bacterium]
MVTATDGKGTVRSPRHLIHFRHAAREATPPTLGSRMAHGAKIGAVLGAAASLGLTTMVAGGLAGLGDVYFGLFGGTVGGAYLGAFVGLVKTPDE